MNEPARIAVTGAAGFLGRRLVQLLRRRHRVIALDRNPMIESQVSGHPNVEWYPVDLADRESLGGTIACIRAGGGVDVLIHLAAYYDFSGEEHPEYQRTNVEAMRMLLDGSRSLGLEHFVFASSVAACPFSTPGHPITEATPPTGEHIYARTKRIGEEMLAEYTDSFAPLIVRFAALFSDWCEYPPMQVQLDTWLGGGWDSRILAGRGESAIPYLHIRDGSRFMMSLLERRHELDPMEILLAGEDGAVSHLEMFRAATTLVDGEPRRPIYLPRPLCRPGIWVRDAVGRTLGARPFERPWMADYIDRRLEIDTSRTRSRLGWDTTPRLSVLERLSFLVGNRRDNPLEWYRRNREAFEHLQLKPNHQIYRLVKSNESAIEHSVKEGLEDLAERAQTSLGLSSEERFWDHQTTLRNLTVAIRSGDNEAFLNWCGDLAARRLDQGFGRDEVIAALHLVGTSVATTLARDAEAAGLGESLRDVIETPIEFGIDRVLEVYEDAAVFGHESRG